MFPLTNLHYLKILNGSKNKTQQIAEFFCTVIENAKIKLKNILKRAKKNQSRLILLSYRFTYRFISGAATSLCFLILKSNN